MKALWTLVKIVIALAIAIPISIIVLATALGILGALVGLAFLALKLAFVVFVGWGVIRLIARVVRGPAKSERRSAAQELPPVDPHYEAAMRELDRELGEVPR
jgi:hypothetical protein